eukprot:4915812-Pleurochrysis_carterae.AAC.1
MEAARTRTAISVVAAGGGCSKGNNISRREGQLSADCGLAVSFRAAKAKLNFGYPAAIATTDTQTI